LVLIGGERATRGGNSRAATQRNLQRELVADRVTVIDGDARQMLL